MFFLFWHWIFVMNQSITKQMKMIDLHKEKTSGDKQKHLIGSPKRRVNRQQRPEVRRFKSNQSTPKTS